MSKITLVEQSSVSIPSAAQASIYIDAITKRLASRNAAGAVTDYGAATSEFADDVFRINDDADPTKQLAFQIASLTTGTTRTITVPDASITLDDAGDSRPPNGSAGGGLGGSYPGPSVNGMTAGSLTDDTAHGNRGGGALHANAIAAGAAGFMTGADKSKLDGIAAGATNDHDSLINVSADDHHAQQHALGGSDHTSATLAQLNALISDANVDDDGDARPPLSHTHVEADITDLDHTDAAAIHDNVAGEIVAVTLKGTPVGADLLLIEDSAAANAKKRVAISSLPTGASTFLALTDTPANYTGQARQPLRVNAAGNAVESVAMPVFRNEYGAFSLGPIFSDGPSGVASAGYSAGTVDANLANLRYDAAALEGRLGEFYLPAGVTELTWRLNHRGNGSSGDVITTLYFQQVSGTGLSWSSAQALSTLALPATVAWQNSAVTITTATLGLTAGNFYQFCIARNGPSGSDTMAGDWRLRRLILSGT